MPSQWATPAETLERTEIIEISSLGWRPRAHPIYHARSLTNSVMLFSCQRPALRHTSTASPPSGSELDKMPQNTDKTKKSGRPLLGGRPLFETGMLIPRRSGHLTHVNIDGPRRTFRFGSELEYMCHAA